MRDRVEWLEDSLIGRNAVVRRGVANRRALHLLIGDDAGVGVQPSRAPRLCPWEPRGRGVVYWACQHHPDKWLGRAMT